jgi:bile acid:Na+ symporter, BASS family
MSDLQDLLSLVIPLLLLTAVGLDLRWQDFRPVRDQPWIIAAGVLLPPIVLPVLALGLIRGLDPSPSAARGLLLLAACPIGGVSTTYSMLARANPALSVTLTTVSCSLGLLTMPLVLAALAGTGVPLGAAPTGALVQQLALVLLPPVALGMAIRARWPVAAARWHHQIQVAAFALLVVLLSMIVTSAARTTTLGWPRTLVLVGAFVSVAYALGAALAALLGTTRADRFTLAAEFGTRNVAVGLAAAGAMGIARDFAWLGALYLAVEIPFMLLAAWVRRPRTASGV